MRKKNTIPILTSDSYGRIYFKNALEKDKVALPSPGIQHFEIHHRNIIKNTIPTHRLDFFLVFIVTGGEGIHKFGLKEYYVQKNMLCFVGPSVISSWQSKADKHEGFFCAFSDDFFNLGRINRHFLNELPFFQIDGNPVLHLTEEQTQYYLSLFQMMQLEYANKNKYSEDVLRSQLQALFHKAHAQYRLECIAAETNRSGTRLLKAYTNLYMADFKRINEGKEVKLKKVSDYADTLGVSQNHLNDTIKAVTGKSAGQLIKEQLIKQATMCLKHSTKSISEIAYLLGYYDPSYFSRYYKKHTGVSPSGFR